MACVIGLLFLDKHFYPNAADEVTIIALLIGSVLAVIVTRFNDRANSRYERRLMSFRELMKFRTDFTSKEFVGGRSWHDLRHTWASWHVQDGTSLQELQHLGAWSSFNMVLRYAHLSSAHLRKAALRIPVIDWLHSEKVANNTGNENVVAA